MGTPSRAARFAAVLAAQLVAHNVGDHLVQTDHQAAGKATSWPAMAGHVGGYTATAALTLLAVDRTIGIGLRPGRLLAGLALSAGSHALIDRRWPVLALLRATGSPAFAELATPVNGPYVADQALHHGCVLLASLLMVGGRG
jgi:hypothetical protein